MSGGVPLDFVTEQYAENSTFACLPMYLDAYHGIKHDAAQDVFLNYYVPLTIPFEYIKHMEKHHITENRQWITFKPLASKTLEESQALLQTDSVAIGFFKNKRLVALLMSKMPKDGGLEKCTRDDRHLFVKERHEHLEKSDLNIDVDGKIINRTLHALLVCPYHNNARAILQLFKNSLPNCLEAPKELNDFLWEEPKAGEQKEHSAQEAHFKQLRDLVVTHFERKPKPKAKPFPSWRTIAAAACAVAVPFIGLACARATLG